MHNGAARPVHRSKKAPALVEEQKGKLKMRFLPPCSPDLARMN
jgi:transposase